MWQYAIKILITSILVIAISEAAKRWTLLGAVIASLPLTSILAMIWLYVDTASIERVNSLSHGIFWVVIPSLLFFLLLPVFTKLGLNFWISLGTASFCTALAYWGYVKILTKAGIEI